MISAMLITLCVGLNYVTTQENLVDYNATAATHSVHVLRNDLRAIRAVLHDFRDGLQERTDNDTRDVFDRMDQSINKPLEAIWNTVSEATTQGKDVDHCFIEAHASANEAANKHLELVTPCINTFRKSTETALSVIPSRLQQVQKIEDKMITILPDCEKKTNKATCIQERLDTVIPPILNFETAADSMVEKGYNVYVAHLDIAKKCVEEHFKDLEKQMYVITSTANQCIGNS